MARKAGSDGGDAHAPPPTGHNLTDEVFLTACKQMAQLNAERKTLNEKVSSARKQMKANGIELGLMDATLKMAEWDRGEVRQHFDRGRQYAAWLGLPVGTQSNLFEGLSDDEVQRQEWYAAGVTAQRAGKPRVAPDECPDAYLTAWDAGFDGRDTKTAGIGSGMRASSAKPKAPKAPKPPKAAKAPKAGKGGDNVVPMKGKGEAPVDGTGKGPDKNPDMWEDDAAKDAAPQAGTGEAPADTVKH